MTPCTRAKAIDRYALLGAAVLCSGGGVVSAAESVGANLGLGLNFAIVEQEVAADFGGGAQVGFEFHETGRFRYGVQWQGLKVGNEDDVGPDAYEDLIFLRSNALYLTARPRNPWLQWLEFKAGPVSAKYKVDLGHEIAEADGMGIAYGIGLVAPSDRFRLHMLDYQRLSVAGQTFDVYSVTVLIVLGLGYMR